jgi:hypothetical protein
MEIIDSIEVYLLGFGKYFMENLRVVLLYKSLIKFLMEEKYYLGAVL